MVLISMFGPSLITQYDMNLSCAQLKGVRTAQSHLTRFSLETTFPLSHHIYQTRHPPHEPASTRLFIHFSFFCGGGGGGSRNRCALATIRNLLWKQSQRWPAIRSMCQTPTCRMLVPLSHTHAHTQTHMNLYESTFWSSSTFLMGCFRHNITA